LGFTEPTKIQKEAIPPILEGKDIIGESATGSGKTLAFGTGIVEKCKPGEGIQAVVLTPTRELAEQVKDDMVSFAKSTKLDMIAIYGGVSIEPQIKNLRKTDVVIATPGRFLDHVNRGTIDTSKVKIFVLDEADRMVEMGFIEDVEKIIRSCPKEKQMMLFSATMYEPAKKIARKYMKNPVTVQGIEMVDPTKLKQKYYEVPNKLKKDLLLHLLKEEDPFLVMIFCNTRNNTENIVRFLKANGIKAVEIHGGLNQPKRLKTIELFHKGKFDVLVCTDVAARGLHIEGVTHIYNYDIPSQPNDYIHRIGRTARAGKEGLVINIVGERDVENFSGVFSMFHEFDIEKMPRPYLKMDSKHPKKEYDNKKGYQKKNFSSGNRQYSKPTRTTGRRYS
jgi:ATP-dependent RNA helicase DeaD